MAWVRTPGAAGETLLSLPGSGAKERYEVLEALFGGELAKY